MSEQKRKKRTAADKLRIVLTSMQPSVEVSALCRQEGVNPTQFYDWKKRLLGSAEAVFDERPKKPDAKQERMERELTRMKSVVAEITAENLELKKTLSD
jgi:transposase